MDNVISAEQLDIIGQHLAYWSDYYHRVISINGHRVNIQGPNGGGYSPVYWQLPLGMALGNQEHLAFLKERNQAIRSNLRIVLEGSRCNLEEMIRYIEGFNDPTKQYGKPESWDPAALKEATPERLGERLGCLGKVEFEEAGWGIM